ncbi:MAG: hypothetical protein JNN32_08510 [Flavobacteriales bacterium]|nr:hypothetical protein [Flavobacteriales bacterium]
MRVELIIVAWSIALCGAQAQGPLCTWARSATFDQSGTSFSQAPDQLVAASPEGGAVLFGVSRWVENYSGDSHGDLQVIHYDGDGGILWASNWSGSALATGLRCTPSGVVVALGEFLDSLRLDQDHLLSTTDNFPHAFVALLDVEGAVEWAVDLNLSFNEARGPRSPVFNEAGELLFGLLSDGSHVVRMDQEGQVLGSIAQSPPAIYGVEVDPFGNVYVTGSCAAPTGTSFNGVDFVPDVSGNGYNRYLVRYRPDGSPAWVKFSGDVTCSTSEVRYDGRGGLYWAGLLFAEADFDTYHVDGPSNGSNPDFHLCRLDTSGNYSWVREGPGGQDNGVGPGLQQYLAVDQAGHAIMAGQGKGVLVWEGGLTTTVNGASDVLLTCFDTEGDIVWCERGDSDDQFDRAHALDIGSDGAIYITGLSRQPITFDDQFVPTTGNTNTPFIARFADLSTSMVEGDGTDDLVYPCPVRDELHLRTDRVWSSVEGVDAVGRVVAVKGAAAGFDVSHLSPGSYSLILHDRNGARSIHRFIKE